MDPMLNHLSSLVPTAGLALKSVSADETFLDVVDSASSLNLLIGTGPGPSVLMTALLPAPPLPAGELTQMAARLQMRVPHIRVHLKKTPSGKTVIFLDDAHLFEPMGSPVDAAWLRGGVDALVRGARALQLLEPYIEDSAAFLLGFSAADADKQQQVRALFTDKGLVVEDERAVLGGDALLVKSADGPPTRVMVRDDTLLFHVAIPLEAPPDVRANVAATVHGRLPFGRILLGPVDGDNAIVEYPYRLRAFIGDYDALHGFEVLGAISDLLVQMFGDDDEEGAAGDDADSARDSDA